ncbi:hypothetical protein J6590_002072 [Homalodisca vitripennis]|nr:hypothetical protein J6590_002072 [Homalodisca vitripennis]
MTVKKPIFSFDDYKHRFSYQIHGHMAKRRNGSHKTLQNPKPNRNVHLYEGCCGARMDMHDARDERNLPVVHVHATFLCGTRAVEELRGICHYKVVNHRTKSAAGKGTAKEDLVK